MYASAFQQLKSLEGQYFNQTASPAGKWLNYQIKKVEPGEIICKLSIRQEMANPLKQLHGGIIGLIADEICGLCFLTMNKEDFYTTVSLNINYLASTEVGKDVEIRARVIRHGKRMANVECYLHSTDGVLLAHATTNLLNSGVKIFPIAILNS